MQQKSKSLNLVTLSV